MSCTSRALCGVIVIAVGIAIAGCASDTAERPSSSSSARRPGEDEATRAERLAREAAANTALEDRARTGAITDNLLKNGSFEEWPEGAKVPADWSPVEQETAAKLARKSGGDAVPRDGKNAVAFTADRGVVSIVSDSVVISDTENGNLRGKMVTAGIWAKADTPAAAFINIRDGVDESPVVDHPGDGTWQFITVSYTLSPQATRASVRIGNRKQDGTATVLFDAGVLVTAQ
jgi:hypothetical protein